MDLLSAIVLAKKFTDAKRAEVGFHTIRLSPGKLVAATAEHGVEVHVPNFDPEGTVAIDAARLSAVFRKADLPLLKVSRNTLEIKGTHGDTKIKGIPVGAFITPPEVPTTGWVALTAEQSRAISALAAAISKTEKEGPSAAACFTPHWVGFFQDAAAALVWVSGTVDRVAVVPVGATIGWDGPVEVALVDGRFWTRSETGVHTWTRTKDAPWPDRSVEEVIVGLRARAETALELGVSALAELADRAVAAADSPVDPCSIRFDAGVLRLEMKGHVGSFKGAVDAPGAPDGQPVGVEPGVFGRGCRALAESTSTQYLGVAGSKDPIRVWGLEPVACEVMFRAAFLPA